MVVTFMKIMRKLCSCKICYSQKKKGLVYGFILYTTIIKCQAAKVLFVVIWLFLRYHLYFLVSRRLLLVNYMFTFFVHANMYNVVYIYLVYNIKCIQIYIMRGRIRNFLVWGAKIKGHILSICVFLDPLIIAIVNFKHQF